MPLAVVTGAGVRLGRAIAIALARAGYDLVLTANASLDAVNQTASDARAHGVAAMVRRADLSQEDEVDRLGSDLRAILPAVDLLVHNAGFFEEVPFHAITRAQYRRMQAINLEAPFFLTQALLPSLQAAPSPAIVLLADIGGERPMNRYAHYSISKAGVVMLTRALAVELGPAIRVNAVAPGTVLFPADFDPEARERLVRRVPLKREGSAEDVAEAVVYLAGATYVSGHVLAVDGGRSAVL
jgi:pteridine reductase